MIRFACPGCSATFTVGEEKAGKAGKCPKCQSQFVIPSASDAGLGPAPASADVPAGTEPPPPPQSEPPPSGSAPPPPADPNQPVEIRPCPKCNTRLTVLPGDVGYDIQCPSCETVFKATRADAPPPPDTGSKRSGNSSLVKLGSGSERQEDKDEDRPSRRRDSRRDRDDDDDDRPSRRRRRDDDEDDADYRPRRRRSYRTDYAPHRGVMILIFGILSWFVCVIFGIVAWVMGSQDLREIDAGRMDPEGRGLTQAGRIIGMISCIFHLVLVLGYCGVFGLMAATGKLK